MRTTYLLLLAYSLYCSATLANENFTDKISRSSLLISNFDYTIPKPKHVQLTDLTCLIGKNTKVNTTSNFREQYSAAIDSLQDTLAFFGKKQKTPLNITLQSPINTKKIIGASPQNLERQGAYVITISCSNISIQANSNEGFINGLTTIESLIATNKGELKTGSIIDYPTTKIRALHLSLWPTSMISYQVAIKHARFGHFNTLILLPQLGVKLNSLPHVALPNAWSIKEFQSAVLFAKTNGLEVIPQLTLLSHQDKFLANAYPQFLFNKLTYDPRIKNLYTTLVFPAIDELLALTGATKFHIGHDEVAGWTDWFVKTGKLNKNEIQLPAALFLQDILTLHKYLSSKHIETWMWGDMLVTKDEFPIMKDAGANLNGYNGYDKLRSKIPKDIVINDWHYKGEQKDFPTALAFAKLDHKVLGATWEKTSTIKNFTQYINQMPYNNEGMIATTWYGLNQAAPKVFNIITQSAEIFWNE